MAVPAPRSQDYRKSQQEIREEPALIPAFLPTLLIQGSLGHVAVHLWFPSLFRILLSVFLVTNAAEIHLDNVFFLFLAISEHLRFPGWQRGSRRLTAFEWRCPVVLIYKSSLKTSWKSMMIFKEPRQSSSKALYICNKTRYFMPGGRPLWKKYHSSFNILSRKKAWNDLRKFHFWFFSINDFS